MTCKYCESAKVIPSLGQSKDSVSAQSVTIVAPRPDLIIYTTNAERYTQKRRLGDGPKLSKGVYLSTSVISSIATTKWFRVFTREFAVTKYYAPWSDAQIDCLKARQDHPRFHPYTCGNDSNHRVLVPTTNGWVCEDCDYTQNWFLITELGFFANQK